MPSSCIQDRLFQQIKSKLPPNGSLADAVAEKLYISADSAYRRIRGETLLVLEEAKTLCEAYQISLDDLMSNKPHAISFTPVKVDAKDSSFEGYLRGILQRLRYVSRFNKNEIIYLTKDIPFFSDFLFKPLSAFHYFFWMKSILQHPAFVHAKFSMNILTDEVEQLGSEIFLEYAKLTSIEIWNNECVNSTISQIEYYRHAGYFESQEDAIELYKSLAETIQHIKLQAEYGCKFIPGEKPHYKQQNFQLFYNNLVLGDNTILVTVDNKRTAYLNYDVLNYMETADEAFCDETEIKLRNLVKRSTMLSHASEKQRNKFFNLLLRKIPLPFDALSQD